MEAQAQTGHFRRQEETKKRQKFGGESRDFKYRDFNNNHGDEERQDRRSCTAERGGKENAYS